MTSIQDDDGDDTRGRALQVEPPETAEGGALTPGGRAVSPSRWLPVFNPTLCIHLGECALCGWRVAGGPVRKLAQH